MTDDVILENVLSLLAAITSNFPIFHRLLGYEAELLSNNINLSIKSHLIRSKIDVKNDRHRRRLKARLIIMQIYNFRLSDPCEESY